MTKFYRHLISLGLNCEIGNQLRIRFGDPEYSFLHWCTVEKPEMLPKIIRNPQIVFSGSVTELSSSNMWKCERTSLVFHGARQPGDLLSENGQRNLAEVGKEKDATLARVKHIAQKFAEMTKNRESKLFVLALHNGFCDYENGKPASIIRNLYKVITQCVHNSQLLVILKQDSGLNSAEYDDLGDLYIRYIRNFAPIDKSMDDNLLDKDGYTKIFAEFRQLEILNKNKVYKFQR